MSSNVKDKAERVCGLCNTCCVVLRIDSRPGYSTRLDNGEDVAKKAGEVCRFLSVNGCSIYDVRPLVCRTFACDWLKRKPNVPADNPVKVGYFSINGRTFYMPGKK